MRKKGKGLYSSIAIAAVIVLVAMGGVLLFSQSVRRIFKAEITNSLSEITNQSVLTLQREINGSLQSMRDLATLIGEAEPIETSKLMETLRAVAQENHFKRMGLVDPDGTAYTTDGKTMNLSDRVFFQNGMQGKSAVSDTLTDKLDGGRINVYSSPVVRDGKVEGVLFATYETDRFRQNLEVSNFDGQGYTYVVKQNGDTVVLSSNKNSFADMTNLFSAMGEADPANRAATVALRERLVERGTGYVVFINRESKYMYYTPLDINDWYLISVVPTSVANEKMNQVMIWSYALIGVILLFFLFLVLHIIHMQAISKKELRRIAYVDPLTGDSTLGKFKMDAEEILRKKEGADKPYSIVTLDIDKFKYINEMFGYQEGNRAILFLSFVLHESLRPGELCAHKGADNFVLLLHSGIQGDLAERLQNISVRMRDFPEQGGSRYDLVLSMGAYEVEGTEPDIDTMIDRAEIPQKTVKGHHAIHYAFFDEAIRAQQLYERNLENKMTKALENRHFCVYYQPKYRTRDRKPAGAEALVRWLDPEWGCILPGKFIPLFESNGFITELDRYVFHEVCRQVRCWLDEGLPVMPISVNISRLHLYNPHFMEDYKNILEQYRIPARLLQLELTESTFFDNRMVMKDIVSNLHQAGFSILMDDFGTGYSSLTMLKDLSVDVLKLDKGFMEDAASNEKGQRIIESIIRMVQSLGMTVTAEGVETDAQYRFLLSVGCDEIQGYYFARPMEAKDFESLLKETAKAGPGPEDMHHIDKGAKPTCSFS